MFVAGAKEIDIAATLEHLRDQRPRMVQTKVLSASPRGCQGFAGVGLCVEVFSRGARVRPAGLLPGQGCTGQDVGSASLQGRGQLRQQPDISA